MIRALTCEEQAILKYVMGTKNLSQQEIARKNNLASATTIWEVCSGKRKINETAIKRFQNCGIDLEEIMRYNEPRPYKTGRILTENEVKALYQKCKSLGVTQKEIAENALTSRSYINSIFKRRQKVTNVGKTHFLKSGIDLDEIME